MAGRQLASESVSFIVAGDRSVSADCVEEPPLEGHVCDVGGFVGKAKWGRVARVAKIGSGKGICFASFRRF